MGGTAVLKAGIVGAGLMGRWHVESIKRAGGRVTAVCDLDLPAAERLANRAAGARGFSDLAQMLEQMPLDVLHICTPTPTHVPFTEKAIEAGVHVLVEKPLAPTGLETERLFDLAATRGVLVCPVHQFPFQKGAMKAKRDLARIGRLVHLRAAIRSAGGVGRSDAEMDQIAADILPHSFSLVQAFLTTDLTAVTWMMKRPSPGELRVWGELAGVTVTIEVSLNGRPTRNSFEIVGAEGTIHLDLFHGYSFVEPGAVSRARKLAHPFDLAARQFGAAAVNLGQRVARREAAYPGLRQLIRLFYTAVQNGTPPISPTEAISAAHARDML